MQRELVVRARDGDLEAFTQLVTVAFPRLKGVAYLVLRDTDRAEDAVQEALVAAWKDLRALRDPDAWDAWLRRLLMRTCYRFAKQRRRLTGLEQLVSPGWLPEPLDGTAHIAQREWVLAELARVDVEKRSVIVLHYYLDLPMREVAEILGIPYGTAASRLHRGLEIMRDSMHDGSDTPTSVTSEQRA